ncbi:hypothetical protein [Salinispira pacifica]
MSSEIERAQSFVQRLLANPALQQFSALQREEQIIQFLNVNAAQLAPTLTVDPYFPGRSWSQVFGILVQAIFRVTNQLLDPELRSIIGEEVSFAFVPFLKQQPYNEGRIREQVASFLTGLLRKADARRAFTGAYAALVFSSVDRYLDDIFERKSYIHFELTKVQRLRMGKEEIRGMILASLLLKPAIYVLAASGSSSGQERVAGTIQSQFAEKATEVLTRQLNLLPEQLIRSAVNSNISFSENRFIEATARMAAIFAARCRSYHPHMRVDRGADSPDKSWLSIARRNYRFYGFDVKMLDELYMIAAENGW